MKRVLPTILLLGGLVLVPATSGANDYPKDLKTKLLILEARHVTVDFEERPLAEVLKFLTQYTGVNLLVSPQLQAEAADRDLNVTLKLTNISVKQVLRIIVDLKGLASVYRHGVIMITTPKDARGKPVLRLYPIGDLTVAIRDFPAPNLLLKPAGAEDFGAIGGGEEEGRESAFADPEFIMDLVSENTGEGTWEDEGVSISVNRRMLVVRQYRTVHREIGRLLALLRAFR